MGGKSFERPCVLLWASSPEHIGIPVGPGQIWVDTSSVPATMIALPTKKHAKHAGCSAQTEAAFASPQAKARQAEH